MQIFDKLCFETKISFLPRAFQAIDLNKPSASARAAQSAHHHSSLLFTVTIHDRNRGKGQERGGYEKPLRIHFWLPASTAADEAIKFHTTASNTPLSSEKFPRRE